MMTAGILQSENPARENLVCTRPVDVSGQIFSDQTGRFPRVSSRGDRAVMVLYDYDSNFILTDPLKKNYFRISESSDAPHSIPPRPWPQAHGPPY